MLIMICTLDTIIYTILPYWASLNPWSQTSLTSPYAYMSPVWKGFPRKPLIIFAIIYMMEHVQRRMMKLVKDLEHKSGATEGAGGV